MEDSPTKSKFNCALNNLFDGLELSCLAGVYQVTLCIPLVIHTSFETECNKKFNDKTTKNLTLRLKFNKTSFL